MLKIFRKWNQTGLLLDSSFFWRVRFSLENATICSICRNKRPGRLIFRNNKKISKPIKSHRFCVLPPLENPPSQAIGFVSSPFEKSLFLVGAYFEVGAYCGKYGVITKITNDSNTYEKNQTQSRWSKWQSMNKNVLSRSWFIQKWFKTFPSTLRALERIFRPAFYLASSSIFVSPPRALLGSKVTVTPP